MFRDEEHVYRDRKHLSKSAQRVLEAMIATSQLHVDWWGASQTMFSQWYGKEVFGIPETTVRRALKELHRQDYIRVRCLKRTYRTARKKGRITKVWELVVVQRMPLMNYSTGETIGYSYHRRLLSDMLQVVRRWKQLEENDGDYIVLRNLPRKNELSRGPWRFGPIGAIERKVYVLERLWSRLDLHQERDMPPPLPVDFPSESERFSRFYRGGGSPRRHTKRSERVPATIFVSRDLPVVCELT